MRQGEPPAPAGRLNLLPSIQPGPAFARAAATTSSAPTSNGRRDVSSVMSYSEGSLTSTFQNLRWKAARARSPSWTRRVASSVDIPSRVASR